ncbi:MAG: hypothetical protein GF332_02655 [Candidatus Moranbacteria bacterium]|nr:hypothetical protein [Candidatus Moranbacteria bacterium]
MTKTNLNKKIYLAIFALILGLIGFGFLLYYSDDQIDLGLSNKATQKKTDQQIIGLNEQKRSKNSHSEQDPAALRALKKNFGRYQHEKPLDLEHDFTAKPLNTTPVFKFVVIGDSESYKTATGYNKELPNVLKVASEQNPDFAVFTGDIITAVDKVSNKTRILNLKHLIDSYFEKYYLVIDKHDIECGLTCVDLWHQIFWNKTFTANQERILYYSFDYENTHFVILSTSYPIKYSLDQKQLDWLERDLAANQKPNTIVFQHVPPVTFFEESAEDCHDLSCSEKAQKRLLDLLQRFKVDLVIAGHEHSFEYQEKYGIDFALSGNCGNSVRYEDEDQTKGDIFTLVEVNQKGINLKGVRVTGKIEKTVKVK